MARGPGRGSFRNPRTRWSPAWQPTELSTTARRRESATGDHPAAAGQWFPGRNADSDRRPSRPGCGSAVAARSAAASYGRPPNRREARKTVPEKRLARRSRDATANVRPQQGELVRRRLPARRRSMSPGPRARCQAVDDRLRTPDGDAPSTACKRDSRRSNSPPGSSVNSPASSRGRLGFALPVAFAGCGGAFSCAARSGAAGSGWTGGAARASEGLATTGPSGSAGGAGPMCLTSAWAQHPLLARGVRREGTRADWQQPPPPAPALPVAAAARPIDAVPRRLPKRLPGPAPSSSPSRTVWQGR